MQEGDIMGTLDKVGMFPNVPVKKTLEIARDKLEKDGLQERNGRLIT